MTPFFFPRLEFIHAAAIAGRHPPFFQFVKKCL
jgi:hypothetical protein